MSIPNSFTLETSRLRLRLLSLEDIPFVFSASQYPGFTDGMLWEPPADASELVGSHQRAIKAWEAGRAYAFTIENKNSAAFLGRISIRQTDELELWNIGFWTHPEHQGQGFMSEAVAAVINFGFEQLEAREIEACYALWNKASERVIQKNGMQFVRYIPEGFKKNGEWVEENLYSIQKQDWEKRSNQQNPVNPVKNSPIQR